MIRAGSVGRKGLIYDEVEWDEKGRTSISDIYVSFGDRFISSIQFGYIENGTLVMSTNFGGSSEGKNFKVVRLNHDEYLTGLSGVLGFGMTGGIRNLTFHTNRGKHGPIGSLNDKNASGSKIEVDAAIRDRREFGGFFGSHSRNCLLSIGINVSYVARFEKMVKRENI